MTASTFAEQIALRKLSADEFVTVFNPDKMGNTANIAYGGCALAVSIAAACESVEPQYRAYSITGNYLGPALTDRPLFASVRRIRTTKNFSTRQVELSQEQNDGSKRSCLFVIADFMVKEELAVLTYSAQPSMKYSKVEDCLTMDALHEHLIKDKGVHPKKIAMKKIVFGLMARYFDQRGCPEGIMAQNLYGIAKELPTTQDDRPVTSKTSADWFKCLVPAKTVSEHLAALSFELDGSLSFVPLSHNHQFIDDAGACSSLEFALRLFTADIDLNDWLLREIRPITAGEGRTFTEARVWDRSGKMVASMTQQCIMRPKPVKSSI
jgi:acyl-CoA thioesterase II